MSLTMRTTLLMCLAGTANMVQMDQPETLTPSEALAMLLMSNDQSAAFNPSNLAASRPAANMRSPGNSILRQMTARAALPIMEDEAPAAEAPAEEAEAPKPSPKTKLEDLEIGSKIMGKVSSVTSFGVFMDIGATSDGLLHISEISDDYIDPEKFTEMFSEGDEKEVRVVAVDLEKKNIRLSSKEAKPALTPLTELEIGQEIEGVVRSTVSYGAFIDIGAKSDGLLHVSELSEGGEFIDDASKVVSPGDKVKCRILAINLDKNQVSLTKKAPGAETRAPAQKGPSKEEQKAIYEKYAEMDDKEYIPGTVSSIMAFGAFVKLAEGVDGLVHISQIGEDRIEDVNAVLSIGDEVNVRVTGVDTRKQQIALSMREWKEPSERPAGGDDFSGFNVDDLSLDDSPFDDLVVMDDDGAWNVFDYALKKERTNRLAKSKKQRSQHNNKNLDMAWYLHGNSRRRGKGKGKKPLEEKEEEVKDTAEEDLEEPMSA